MQPDQEDKGVSNRLAIGIGAGLAVGVVVAILFQDMGLGFVIGTIGVAFGVAVSTFRQR